MWLPRRLNVAITLLRRLDIALERHSFGPAATAAAEALHYAAPLRQARGGDLLPQLREEGRVDAVLPPYDPGAHLVGAGK